VLQRLALPLVFLLCAITASGQDILNITLDGTEQGKPLPEWFKQLEQKYPVRFYYLDSWFTNSTIQKSYRGQRLQQALADIFEGTEISYGILYNYAIVFSKDPGRALERERILTRARAAQQDVVVAVVGDTTQAPAKGAVSVRGVVTDQETGAALSGASVYVNDLNRGVISDAAGKYTVTLPSGEYVFTVRNINYDEKVVSLRVVNNGTLNLNLQESAKLLDEVVINDQQLYSAVSGKLGVTNLKLTDLKKLPAFLGEVDIIKQIQTLPGVTSVGEVSSGFNVRGGSADQNLVLYDGVQVFNTSHVFGFFSSFNSEAVSDAQFYKAGIPSEYGGRVSSVLSLHAKEGNFEKWHASGGIGLISSYLTVEGPVKEKVSSVVASVRSSYSDWMLKAFTKDYPDVQNSSVSFYDASLKYTHKLNASSKLSLSGYMSQDRFGLPSDTTFHWQNALGSLRYDNVISKNVLLNVTAAFGQYGYTVEDADPTTAYKLRYTIQYPSIHADVNWQAGRHKLTFGVASTYYVVKPPTLDPESGESSATTFHRMDEHYWEKALYVGDGYELGDKWLLDVGVRLSAFTALGKADVYQYTPGVTRSVNSITDTIHYASGKAIKTYTGFEPRASLRYTVTPTVSIKAAYDRIYQYLHLISNSVAISPIDVWQPSNAYFSPQIGDQISLGVFKSLNDNMYEASVEVYQKWIKDILDFRDGADLVLNPALETALLQGKAHGYGVELSFNKTKGRLSWNFNYTYARTFRTVAGINDGKRYPSNYDQPNIVNLNWKYGLSRRFSLTGNFNYRTGRPITVPYSYTVIDNTPVVNFSSRNGYRVPDYHRLDLALVIEGNHKKKKFWDGTWVVSFYNVYGRKNVYTVFYDRNANGLQQAYRMSIVGTILPSISYRFKL